DPALEQTRTHLEPRCSARHRAHVRAQRAAEWRRLWRSRRPPFLEHVDVQRDAVTPGFVEHREQRAALGFEILFRVDPPVDREHAPTGYDVEIRSRLHA